MIDTYIRERFFLNFLSPMFAWFMIFLLGVLLWSFFYFLLFQVLENFKPGSFNISSWITTWSTLIWGIFSFGVSLFFFLEDDEIQLYRDFKKNRKKTKNKEREKKINSYLYLKEFESVKKEIEHYNLEVESEISKIEEKRKKEKKMKSDYISIKREIKNIILKLDKIEDDTSKYDLDEDIMLLKKKTFTKTLESLAKKEEKLRLNLNLLPEKEKEDKLKEENEVFNNEFNELDRLNFHLNEINKIKKSIV